MKDLPIVQGRDHPTLRTVSAPVEKIDKDLLKLLPKMVDTMHVANGVGLAAPQIGKNIRVFVMKLFKPSDDRKGTHDTYSIQEMINPEIVSVSSATLTDEEGCLSVPGVFGSVKRYASLRVRFLNKKGVQQTLDLSGLNARIIQHETDHLNGKLCVDIMEKVTKEPQNERLKEYNKKRLAQEKEGGSLAKSKKKELDA